MTLPCAFCNHRCNFNDMRQTYWCKTCKVNYDGNTEYLFKITFDTTIKDIQYELTIDVERNTTKLQYWNMFPGQSNGIKADFLKNIVEFQPAMKGITPPKYPR